MVPSSSPHNLHNWSYTILFCCSPSCSTGDHCWGRQTRDGHQDRTLQEHFHSRRLFLLLYLKKVGMTYIDASYIDDVSLWGLHYWVIQWQWIRKLVSQWASSFVSQVEWGLFSLSECSTFYESLHVPHSPVFFEKQSTILWVKLII